MKLLVNLFDEHIERFDDHFICDEQINGYIKCNKICSRT